VYPSGPCVYCFDPTEYYTVGPGDPLYDPAFDRGGLVLLETGTGEIDWSIYQAPDIVRFQPSVDGNDGYVFLTPDVELIVDTFSNEPRVYSNVIVVFDRFTPAGCTPAILVNGAPIAGNRFYMGDLAALTPTAWGNNYSDTSTLLIQWAGCSGIRIWAFADENYNGIKDGGECFTAYSHDASIAVESSSWGNIKAMHRR
ncbi:MAG: hypothetical protein PHQ19_07690, partial [Candidatus Krumholzibacteria bacterium]|nr:hypothetical protein [Candidatus Krumholzibacteria bacterium]